MALIPLDYSAIRNVAVPDAMGVINNGMELGNKIQNVRQQRGLAHLLGMQGVVGEDGSFDQQAAINAVRQNYSGGLAGLLTQSVMGLGQQQQKALLDAQKTKAEISKSNADVVRSGFQNQESQANVLKTGVETTGLTQKNGKELDQSIAQQLASAPNRNAALGILQDMWRNNRIDGNALTSWAGRIMPATDDTFPALQDSFALMATDDPAKYRIEDANSKAGNLTSEGNNIRTVNASIQNNKLDNTTSVANNVRTTNASLTNNQNTVGATMRGQDISAASVRAKKMQLPTPALKLVTQFQGNVDTADLAASKLTNLTALVDTANLGFFNNLASEGLNRAGYSNQQSQAYERVKAGINDAANTILSAAKGVQTDGDAQRARSIVLASNSSDPKVVKQAINDLITLNDEIKSRNQNQIGGVYANYGLDPNEYFNSGGQAPQPQQPAQSAGGRTMSVGDARRAAAMAKISYAEAVKSLAAQGITVK